MNASKYLIALAIAVSITGLEFAGLSLLAEDAVQTARRIATPDLGIPVLPEIHVRPTREEVRAAFAGADLASTAHPDDAMPFYSFAAKPAVVNKG
ncbi:MAG: hypothetical protein JSR27_07095 [Proteobacteria bacterium]|nr:hypothetical protein [Pseudomonadota bacterium]